MVTPNLYGSLLSNICCGLVGGPGICGGANVGSNLAVFEQGARHVGADIAGQNRANPTGMLLASVMMLRHLNLPGFADRIERAVLDVHANKAAVTRDVGGTATTTDFVKARTFDTLMLLPRRLACQSQMADPVMSCRLSCLMWCVCSVGFPRASLKRLFSVISLSVSVACYFKFSSILSYSAVHIVCIQIYSKEMDRIKAAEDRISLDMEGENRICSFGNGFQWNKQQRKWKRQCGGGGGRHSVR